MTSKKASVDWARLAQIWGELSNPGHPLCHALLTLSREAVIANAVRSGSFPVRGHRDLASHAGDDFAILNRGNAYERLDNLMTPDARISVYGDTVTVKLPPREIFNPPPSVFTPQPRWIKYNDVEASRGAVEAWIRENALPADWIIAASPTSEVDQRDDAELVARKYLEGLPDDAPIMTKEEFRRFFYDELYDRCGQGKLSDRALDRVWASAPKAWRKPGRRPANKG